MRHRFILPLSASLLLAVGIALAAVPQQRVAVKLQDPSSEATIGHMQVVVDHDTVKPGRVTFTAENESKNLTHELIGARDDSGTTTNLPFDTKRDRVIESRIRRLGEISDLPPGRTGTLTLNLRPGKYVLLCNQPGHYKDGMVAKLTVAP